MQRPEGTTGARTMERMIQTSWDRGCKGHNRGGKGLQGTKKQDVGKEKKSMDQNGAGEMGKEGIRQTFMDSVRDLNFILLRSGKHRNVLSMDQRD